MVLRQPGPHLRARGLRGEGYRSHSIRESDRDRGGGESIVLEARIIAVADVVEAMSSHRPYRPALGIVMALEEIEKNSGILYAPEVVQACTELFREGKFAFSD